ncbi:hypothetical protein ACQ4PT_025815 [Festuca glaucescens]
MAMAHGASVQELSRHTPMDCQAIWSLTHVLIMEEEPVYNLKDRFRAKCLRLFVDRQLLQPKRDDIERRSAFKSMLSVAPFSVSNRLLDFIVTHTSYELREFSYHGKRILFTTDMIRKVFNIPSGNRPVDLINRSVPCQLRDIYKQDNPRPPIKNAEKIVYMDHLEFPPNEYVIDYSLSRACHVKSKDFEFLVATDIDKKKLSNSTVFARRPFLPLSKTPYAQAALPAETVEEVDVNPSASLNEWLVPGFPSSQELEVPARYKHLHDKHKAIYAADVDATIKNLGVGLKRMYSQRMSALLVDVDAAIREEDGPSLVFPSARNDEDDYNDAEKDVDDHVDKVAYYPDVHARSGILDVSQPAILVDSSCKGGDIGVQQCVDSPVRSPYPSGVPRGISVEDWNRAPDPPSMDLFPPGSEEYDDFNRIPDSPSHKTVEKPDTAGDDTAMSYVEKPAAATTEAETSVQSLVNVDAADLGEPKTPVGPKSADVVSKDSNEKDATIGVETIDKRNRSKRAAKDELTPPKMKKIRVSQHTVHTYDKFVIHGRKFKRQPKNDTLSFVASLKPRMPLDSQVMDVWVEKFNRESALLAAKSQRSKKKYAFSQLMVLKLIVDPATFNPNESMKDFKLAVSQFKILKDDLLYFPVVKEYHWIVCCVNLVHKQYHIFGSLMCADGTSKLQAAANNLFTNFRRLVDQSGVAKIDWPLYNLITPDHPQ